MRFLTYQECGTWCADRDFPTCKVPGTIVGPEPDLREPTFSFAQFDIPPDSGEKVALARKLHSLLDPKAETLFWLGDWAVWPSSQHMPLFTRWREAFGETRPLIEAPGQLLGPHEVDDAVSLFVVSLQFIWDCHALCGSGSDAIHVSHDEYGWFASRNVFRVKVARDVILERA